jgi:hypothetical protein
MNKVIISGIVAEPPMKYALGENLCTVRIKNKAVLRLNQKQSRTIETIQSVCIPVDFLPEQLEPGDSVYMDCVNVPAFSLCAEQHIDVIWANTVHITSTVPILKAV